MFAAADDSRWFRPEQDPLTDTVVRLHEALSRTCVTEVRGFAKVAAGHMRSMLRELADRARSTHIARDISRWAKLHATVDALPEDVREVFDLMLYWGLTRPEVSSVLGISRKAVEHRWREGRLTLQDALQEGVRPELQQEPASVPLTASSPRHLPPLAAR
jgi:hypothetical protein